MKAIAAYLILAGLGVSLGQEHGGGHALFVRTSTSTAAHSRVRRAAPASAADVLAQNILEWIQGIYRQGARKPRQQSDPPGYLPPYSTQRPPEKPRPFQAPSTSQQPTYLSTARNDAINYPYQGPSTGFSPPDVAQRSTYLPPNDRSTYRPSSYDPSPTVTTSYHDFGSSAFPPYSTTAGPASASQSAYPASDTVSTNYGYPSSSFGSAAATSKLSGATGFSTGYAYPAQRPSPTYVPSTATAPSVSSSIGYTYPSIEAGGNSYDGDIASGYPSSASDKTLPQNVGSGSSGAGEAAIGVGKVPALEGSSGSGTVTVDEAAAEDADDDSKHPPHIHALEVQCSKTMMNIDIEFNRAFDGVIYSKGYFMNPECRYVEQNSGQTKYSFTVSLDSCGTQFINDFAGEAGQAYLENVLVLQNEPGIQEVWDTVRRVRCLWEGNINKALSVNFSVDMLNQEIVTFSGDTAIAKLDIQVGRGPFAPAADGLVKIGEIMTLVVSVEGDPAFDLQVRDCVARDESSSNTIQLTDERGCILKPKLFGAFQKTNDTGNTGASIIAYAYFQAFKFPDVMDLFMECNVELCKTDCEPCPDPNQQIEPRRRRRSATYTPSNTPLNRTAELLTDPIRVARGFRVIMVDDLTGDGNRVLGQLEETAVEEIARNTMNVCMTYSGFYIAISFVLSTVLVSTISALALYIKLQRLHRSKIVN